MARCASRRAAGKWRAAWVIGGLVVVTTCSAVPPLDPPISPPNAAESSRPGLADSDGEVRHTQAMDRNAGQQALRQRLRMHGRLPVIIFLNVPSSDLSSRGPSEARQEATLADIQKRVIDRLIRVTGLSRTDLAIKTFSVTPALALQIDEPALDALLADPAVSYITEDSAVPPAGF